MLVVALAMTACYRPELERCVVACTDFCPANQSCLADGFCHAAGDSELCTPDASVPPAIGVLTAGERHACVIDRDGRLACWGSNHELQLGVGPGTRRALIGTEIMGPAGGPAG